MENATKNISQLNHLVDKDFTRIRRSEDNDKLSNDKLSNDTSLDRPRKRKEPALAEYGSNFSFLSDSDGSFVEDIIDCAEFCSDVPILRSAILESSSIRDRNNRSRSKESVLDDLENIVKVFLIGIVSISNTLGCNTTGSFDVQGSSFRCKGQRVLAYSLSYGCKPD